MNRIEINFVECSPAPPGGYSVVYREKGSLNALASAGIFYSSPAIFFDTASPDGSLFEGFISSNFTGLTCNQIPWESGGASSSSGTSSINIIGTILNSPHGIFVVLASPAPCDVTFPIEGLADVMGGTLVFSADVTVLSGATTGSNLSAIPAGTITCIRPTTAGQTTYVYSALCGSTVYIFTLEIDNPC